MITHIFSDLDGTLLNETGNITEKNAATIIESGIPFSLVSARTPNDMAPIVDKLQLTSPQVAFNGGLIYRNEGDQRVIISEEFIEWNLAEKIITLIQTYYPMLSFSFYDDDNWYTCKIDEGIKKEESIGSQIPKVVEREVFFRQEPRKIFKIMLWIFDAEVMEEVKNFFNKLEIEELAFTQSSPYTLEITNIKAQKAKGIDYILSHYDLDVAQVAAFGDGHNDISMLEKVGHPVVMGNASDEVKAYGRYITKTNLEDGVSYGIETYLLKK